MPNSARSQRMPHGPTRNRRASLAFAAIATAVIAAGVISGVPAEAAFPGENGKIAFQRGGEIYTIDPDGSGLTRLTDDPGVLNAAPAWSPDGRRIAFRSAKGGPSGIFVMNDDGTGQRRLTSSPAGDFSPAWSPDGRRIAFHSFRDGTAEIYVMNADGTGQTRLTSNPEPDANPSWSPDGRRIAFQSSRDGDPEIYVINPDGSGETRLTTNPDARDAQPSWSPDGRRIAFESSRDGELEVYVMNAVGSGQTRLTNRPSERDANPTWSPDGRKIAFESRQGDQTDIHLINPDGSGRTNLTNNPVNDSNPSWQPRPGPEPAEVTEIAPAQQKLRRGRPAVFTAQVSGEAEQLEWILPRGGRITGPADQSSVRFRPRPGRENTVRVRAIGPGGVSEVVAHTFTAPPMPKAKLARRVLRLTLNQPPTAAVGGSPQGLVSSEEGCSPQTVTQGPLQVSGQCLVPISKLTDIPASERGIVQQLMDWLGLSGGAGPGGGGPTNFTTQQVQQGLSFTDAYVTRGNAPITINEGLNMQRRESASIAIFPNLRSIASSNFALGVGGHVLAREQNKIIRLGPGLHGKNDVATVGAESFPPPGTLAHLGRLNVVDDLTVRLRWDRDTGERFTTVRTKLRLPSFLKRVPQLPTPEAGVTVRATETDLTLDGLRITLDEADIGALKLEDLEVSYSRENHHDLWSGRGKACILEKKCLEMAIAIEDGDFKSAGASLSFGTNGLFLAPPDVRLRSIGFDLERNPTVLAGTANVSFVQILTIDGTLVLAFPTAEKPFVLDPAKKIGVVDMGGFPRKQTFTKPMFGVAAAASLNPPGVNFNIPLGSGYAIWEFPSYVALGGQVDRKILKVFKIKGRVDGEFNVQRKRFNVDGSVQVCIQLRKERCASGVNGVISSRGAAGCLRVLGVNVGAGRWWSGGHKLYWRACTLSPFRQPDVQSAGAATAAADSPHVVRIPRALGPRAQNVELVGDGAAPLVRVIGPGGRVLLESDPEEDIVATEDQSIGILSSEGEETPEEGERNFTVVGFKGARPGRYRIEPLEASAPVEEIGEATEPARARVRGTVRGKGKRRVLRYDVRRRPNQRVTFVEVTRGGTVNELRTVRGGGQGRVRFRPQPARGKSRIEARFEVNRLPAEQRRVARFDPPRPRLGKPRRLRVNRTGNRLRMSWRRVRGASHYEITVRGRGLRQRSRTTRRPRAAIKRIPRTRRGRVTVRAVDRMAGLTVRQSSPARARFRRTARPRPNLRSLPRCTQRRARVRCRARR